jgi:annexin A7/11/annexin A13
VSCPSASISNTHDCLYNNNISWGTDEGGLIAALADKSSEMRYLINERYEAKFGTDLCKVMKSECGSGDFGLALQFQASGPVEAEAAMLAQAMKGLGTKERLIYPILCGRCNEDIVKLKEVYFEKHGKDLGVQLVSFYYGFDGRR